MDPFRGDHGSLNGAKPQSVVMASEFEVLRDRAWYLKYARVPVWIKAEAALAGR